MSKKSEEHRRGPQYKQAKRQGYRARSAFKLFDIQKRYNIFKRAYYILDIGSVPGSWLQVAKKFAMENLDKYNDKFYHRNHFKIMGVDIKKVSPIEGVQIVQADATTPEFQNKIKEFFQDQLDLILSDASIKKSGNKFSDNIRQTNLCYDILSLAKFLKYKGIFVIKTFQGQDFDKFLKAVKKRFLFVHSYKPKSSKKGSNEIYLIAEKKKK